MTTPAHATSIWRFGVFEVDAQAGELRRVGMRIKLREQSFRLLLLLLSRPGEVVSREDLRKALWPEDTFVDFDHSLNAAMMKLREALGDTADKPLYIETIPRRGYRFIAPLVPAAQAPDDTSIRGPRVRASWRFWLNLSIGVVLVCGAGLWIALRPAPRPHVVEYIQLTHDPRWKDVAGAGSDRVYVNLFVPDLVMQLSPSGGELVPIPIHLPGEDKPIAGLAYNDYPNLFDVSPDGSTFLCWGPSHGLWTVTNTGDPIRYFGRAEGAAWSPDGKEIVYSWIGDIFVVRSDGSDLRMIAARTSFPSPPLGNFEFAWSPDGGRIRFTRAHDLWEVSPTGTNLHRLLPDWKPSSWKSYGHWTPDGGLFVFLTGEPNSIPFMSGSQLWALDERRTWRGRTDRQPIQLTSGPTRWGRPIPSRDGGRIFAHGVVLNGELVRHDQRTQQWSPYLGGKSVEFVTFSPDGKSVAYAAFPDEVLYRMTLDGKALMRLTEPSLAVKSASWSPDGTRILISADRANDPVEMYLIPAQGGPAKRVIPEDKDTEADAWWSPDGAKIVYSTAGDLWEELHPVEIRIFDLASGKSTALPGSGEEFSPRWSPDSRHIAALTLSEHKLKLFDLTRQRWRTIYEGITDFPTWSRDGRYIYFVGGPDGISRVPASGGKIETVASGKGVEGTGTGGLWFGLDRDDAPLILRNKGTEEVYALTLARK